MYKCGTLRPELLRESEMLKKIASVLRHTSVEIYWIVSTFTRCRYYAFVANRRAKELSLLLNCVGLVFKENSERFSAAGWHTQPRPGYCTNSNDVRISEICWEAPACLTVYLDEKPQLGMAVELRGDCLCIWQLQGAPGAQLPVELKKWPQLFVYAAKLFAVNQSRVKTLRLYAADQRYWYNHPTGELTAGELRSYQQNLRRRYDGTARQAGFKRVHRRYFEWIAPKDEKGTN